MSLPPDFEYVVTPFGPFHREPRKLDLADLAYVRLAQTGMVWMWGEDNHAEKVRLVPVDESLDVW